MTPLDRLSARLQRSESALSDKRATLAYERANLKTQLRAQIANQASWVFVLLNAGGLAALFTWLQALPLEPDTNSCSFVLLRSLPFASALLLIGLFATVISYIFRYHASFYERRAVAWMIALSLAATFTILAGGLIGYSIFNCRTLAWDAKHDEDTQRLMAQYRLARASKDENTILDEAADQADAAMDQLSLGIAEGRLKDLAKLEADLDRARKVEEELRRRIGENESGKSQGLEHQLAEAMEVKAHFEKRLRNTIERPPK